MAWIDEKLEESGETIDNEGDGNGDGDDEEGSEIKRVLSEILEQPDFEESYTLDKTEDKNDKNRMESES